MILALFGIFLVWLSWPTIGGVIIGCILILIGVIRRLFCIKNGCGTSQTTHNIAHGTHYDDIDSCSDGGDCDGGSGD